MVERDFELPEASKDFPVQKKREPKEEDRWAEGGTATEKNAVYNSKKMLNWLNVNDGFKAFREGPKVDLRKDLRVSKRVNLIA